jgi:hypothetical protein
VVVVVGHMELAAGTLASLALVDRLASLALGDTLTSRALADSLGTLDSLDTSDILVVVT